jgi:ABC-2 type transport system ATP-binding protein
VLRGADAEFESGGVHVIVGGNGVGKSTLLHALSGRLSPVAGDIRWVGGDGSIRFGRRLREVVSWLGHDLGLYPDLTVSENIGLHAELRGFAPQQSWSGVGATLGLTPLLARRVRELSRGQRQRAALGRVLVSDPAAVLLDEPSTGLDAGAVVTLAKVLVSVAAGGRCVVVVTHDAFFQQELSRSSSRASESGAPARRVLSFMMRGGALTAVAE